MNSTNYIYFYYGFPKHMLTYLIETESNEQYKSLQHFKFDLLDSTQIRIPIYIQIR